MKKHTAYSKMLFGSNKVLNGDKKDYILAPENSVNILKVCKLLSENINRECYIVLGVTSAS